MSRSRVAVYEEITQWPLWAAGLVWGGCLLGAVLSFEALGDGADGGDPYAAVTGAAMVLAAPLAIQALFGRLRVRVTRTSLNLTFGYTPFITKVIEFRDIRAMEAVRYSPLKEFGGWGIRFSFRNGKRAWSMRGNRALVLHLADGKRFYVGSDDPGHLAARIRLVADIPDGPATPPTDA